MDDERQALSTTLAPARVTHVTADLRGNAQFPEQRHVLAAALDRAPIGATIRVRLDERTKLPPEGWALALLADGYRYEFTGTASACAAWLDTYQREYATRQRWRDSRPSELRWGR